MEENFDLKEPSNSNGNPDPNFDANAKVNIENPEPVTPKPMQIGGEADQTIHNKQYIYIFLMVVTSSAFTQGFYARWFAPIGVDWLIQEKGITDTEEQSQYLGNVNLILCLGAAFGSPLGGFLAEQIGRNKTMLYLEYVRVLVVGLYMFNSTPVLYINRFLDGMTIGMGLVVAPQLIHEVSPARYKTFTGIALFACIGLGIVCTSMPGLIFGSEKLTENWRLFVLIPSILNILRIIGLMCYNIESPQYYLTKYGQRFDRKKINLLRRRSSLKSERTHFLKSNLATSQKSMFSKNGFQEVPIDNSVRTDDIQQSLGQNNTVDQNNYTPVKQEAQINQQASSRYNETNLSPENPNKNFENTNDPLECSELMKEKEIIDKLDPVDLALTFEERYEFYLDDKYQKIIYKNLNKFYTEESVPKVYEGLLLEHKRKQMLPTVHLKDMCKKHYRKRFIIGIVLVCFHQLSGINYFLYYTVQIFNEVNGSGQVMYCILSWIFIFSFIPSWLFGKSFGRKFNFLVGILGQSVSALAMALMVIYEWYTILWQPMVIYVLAFGIGFGATTILYMSEILPPIAIGVAVMNVWQASAIITKSAPLIALKIGVEYVFLFFVLTSLIGFAFDWVFLRETRGRTLLEIEESFVGLKCDFKS